MLFFVGGEPMSCFDDLMDGYMLVILHYLFFLTVNMVKFRNFKTAFKTVPFEVEARRFEQTRK